MFRWNLMLRTLSASPRQQSKARCSRTVRPHLEELTPRILPSASSLPVVPVASPPPVPSVAAITSFMTSMMELRAQLITTIEQDLSNALYTVGQVIAQEAYSFEEELGGILGINFAGPQPWQSSAATPPGSGATTTTPDARAPTPSSSTASTVGTGHT